MFTEFRGKGAYQAEFDVHFPSLTMRETLEFAYKARRPECERNGWSTTIEDEASTLGLAKALDTKMGNVLHPGVSGGERKRTSIAVCHDNDSRELLANANHVRKYCSRIVSSNVGITAPEGWTASMPLISSKPFDNEPPRVDLSQ